VEQLQPGAVELVQGLLDRRDGGEVDGVLPAEHAGEAARHPAPEPGERPEVRLPAGLEHRVAVRHRGALEHAGLLVEQVQHHPVRRDRHQQAGHLRQAGVQRGGAEQRVGGVGEQREAQVGAAERVDPRPGRGARPGSRAAVHVVERDDRARPDAGDDDGRHGPGDLDRPAVLAGEGLTLARRGPRVPDRLDHGGFPGRHRGAVRAARPQPVVEQHAGQLGLAEPQQLLRRR